MKKALIITYYWPPAGGAGVQRWLKFVKYLRDYGWEPVIYTPENPEIPEFDDSLSKDIPKDIAILKQAIWEPYNIYKIITFSKNKKINVGFLSENKKPGMAEKLSVWIRSNFFIPDARCCWINPSVKFLIKYISENPVDVVISTGPPHSLHVIAMKLKSYFFSSNLKWIADFRDPWTNIDFYQELQLTAMADRKHRKLELEVLKNADVVITVGKTMADEFNEINRREYKVLTNGYDTDDVDGLNLKTIIPDDKFSIAHIGSLPRQRNPHVLWKLIKDITDLDKNIASDIEIKLIGKTDINVKNDIINFGIDKYVKFIEYLPHNEVTLVQQKAQLLLLLINQTQNAKGILTGKFFEYLASGRPILCLGPVDGEISEIITNTKSGKVIEFCDYDGLKRCLNDFYELYKKNELKVNTENISQYSRKELTKKLSEILNSVT